MQEHDAFPEGGQEQMEGTSPSTNPLHDEHVKHVAMLVTALVVLLSLAGFLWFYTSSKDETTVPSAPIGQEVTPEQSLSVKSCEEYTSPEEVYREATENDDEYACRCIEDEEFQQTCKLAVQDGQFFNNAVTYMDAEMCTQISKEALVERCEMFVVSSIEHFKTEDAQYLADTYAHTHNENSIVEYEALLEIEPDNIDNLLSLAIAYAEKGLKEQEMGNDQTPYVEKAFEAVEKAKAIEETSEVYRAEGYVYEIKPDIHAALTSYHKAIELDANNALAYVGQGHAQSMLGMLEDAIVSYEKAAELDTQNRMTRVYVSLCNLEYSRGEFDTAETWCRTALENKEGDTVFRSTAYQMLATLAVQYGDYHLSDTYLNNAVSLTPNDPNLYESWVQVNLYEGAYEEAETHARKAVALAPNKASAHLSLSQALYMNDKYEESIAIAEKGLTLVDDDVTLLEPSKSGLRSDLYFSIANNYRVLEDSENEAKYVALAEEEREKLEQLMPEPLPNQ